jgi:hypothetical protein
VPSADELADYLAEEERKRAAEHKPLSFAQRLRRRWKQMSSRSIAGNLVFAARKLIGKRVEEAPAPTPHPRGQALYPATLMQHRLRPYPGRVQLLIDDETFALYGQLGWEKAAIGGLDLHVLPGTHISYIREQGEHAARKLQEILGEALQRA